MIGIVGQVHQIHLYRKAISHSNVFDCSIIYNTSQRILDPHAAQPFHRGVVVSRRPDVEACEKAEPALIEKLLEVRRRLVEADLGEGIATALWGAV